MVAEPPGIYGDNHLGLKINKNAAGAAKNEFPGDDEANLFIRREQRSPWEITV